MKIIAIILLFTFCLCTTSYAEIATSLWHVGKSEHFIIYYKSAPSGYIDGVLKKAESYYDTITGELGFTRFEGFWTWDKRAKIYLYDTKEEYTKETGRLEWAVAHADVISREIYSYVNMKNFLEVILPHELGHIVFREFIGFNRRLPLWLDEGVVSYLERQQRAEKLKMVRAFLKNGSFLSLSRLSKAQAGPDMAPEVFYPEAFSVIEFLVETYGRDNFAEFCRKLRDLRGDKDWFAAFQAAYNFKDLDDMNEKWIAFLKHEG